MSKLHTAVAKSAMAAKRSNTELNFGGRAQARAHSTSVSTSDRAGKAAQELFPVKQTAETFRCRLYRIMKNAMLGKDLFTEVWDSLENPYDESKLPTGKLIFEFANSSRTEVRAHTDKFRSEHHCELCGDWSSRGTI